MSRLGVAISVLFVLSALLLALTKDGEIMVAIISWPSSIVMGVYCDRAGAFCSSGHGLFVSLVLLGAVQYYVLGWVAEVLMKVARAIYGRRR